MGLKFAPVSLSCVYGMTWKDTVNLTNEETGEPVDLTGCELVMRIRASLQSEDALLELTTTGEDATLAVTDGLNGTFTIDVPKETMQALPDPRPRKYRKYVYDMTIIRGADHEPGVSGRFRLSAQITRAWQTLS